MPSARCKNPQQPITVHHPFPQKSRSLWFKERPPRLQTPKAANRFS